MKIHTRAKRMAGLGTSLSHRKVQQKSKGARTFASEQQAKDYAAKLGIKKFSIKKVKRDKRFQIVQE